MGYQHINNNAAIKIEINTNVTVNKYGYISIY